MTLEPKQRISLEEGIKSMSDVEYAEYIISTMGGRFGECDKCQKDALEAIHSRPAPSEPVAMECIGRFDECRTWDEKGCECVAYCIMAANNMRRSRPAPSQGEMEERFISKRQAWEQGYQDGQSSVQHDLHLLRHEATAQARDDVLYDVYLHFVDWYMNPDKYNECNPKECYKYIESLRSREGGDE